MALRDFDLLEKTRFLYRKIKCDWGSTGGKIYILWCFFFFLKFELQRHFQIQNLVPISKQPNRNYNYSTVAGWNIIDCVFQIPLPTPTPKININQTISLCISLLFGLASSFIVIWTVKEPKRLKSPSGPADAWLTVFTWYPIG